MYVGHAAVALALKSREPRLPIVPLALACFGPDWLELAFMFPHPREGMALYTHSIPAVMIGALVAAATYAATRRPGARLILLGWLLHWPADLFTGRKPIFESTPLIGLDLYKLPAVDFALESAAILIGCAIYAHRYAPHGEVRRLVMRLGVALVLLQGVVDLALSLMRNGEWTPSLAQGGWQPHVVCAGVSATSYSACLLHSSSRTQTAREQWRKTATAA